MVYGHAGALVDPEVKLVKGDLGDASVVYPLLMKGNFDAVIHFAAFINVGESVQNPLKYYMNNIARPLLHLRHVWRSHPDSYPGNGKAGSYQSLREFQVHAGKSLQGLRPRLGSQKRFSALF